MSVKTAMEQSLSSDMGSVGFDGGLANRDKIVAGYIKLLSHPDDTVADELGSEILSSVATIFPGMGGFASGGGPLPS